MKLACWMWRSVCSDCFGYSKRLGRYVNLYEDSHIYDWLDQCVGTVNLVMYKRKYVLFRKILSNWNNLGYLRNIRLQVLYSISREKKDMYIVLWKNSLIFLPLNTSSENAFSEWVRSSVVYRINEIAWLCEQSFVQAANKNIWKLQITFLFILESTEITGR